MENPKGIYSGDPLPPLAQRPSQAFPPSAPPVDPLRHHSHRRRRRRRRDANIQGWLWLGAILLLAGFLLALIYAHRHPELFSRPAKTPPPSAPPAPPPALVGAPQAGDTVSVPASGIRELIIEWTGARRALNDAASLQREGQVEEAVVRLKAALVRNPGDLDLLTALAELHVQQRTFGEASDVLLRVLAADPERTSARLLLAQCLDEQRRHEDALAVCRWMLEKDPYAIDVHQMAAHACLATGKNDEAVDHLKKVTGVQRDNTPAFNMLAQAYSSLGDFAQAEEVLQQVLKLDGKDSAGYYNLAVCRAHRGSATGAVEVLNRAVSLFGAPFVASWAASPEFTAISTNAVFADWRKELAAGPKPAAAKTP